MNKARQQYDELPPTKAALIEHAKRAVYQAGRVWGQVLVADPELPSPCNCSWKKNETGGLMLSGHCCQKLVLLVGNSSIGSARKDAENNASVTSLHSDVLHSVYVMVSVPKMNILSHK